MSWSNHIEATRLNIPRVFSPTSFLKKGQKLSDHVIFEKMKIIWKEAESSA